MIFRYLQTTQSITIETRLFTMELAIVLEIDRSQSYRITIPKRRSEIQLY